MDPIRGLVIVASLAVCGYAVMLPMRPDTTSPFLTSEHCYEWKDDVILMPVIMSTPCGANCWSTTTILQPTPVATCAAAIALVEPNPDYKAPTP